MTHLKIEQNTGVIEEVSSAVIKKLYDLVYSGTLDNTSNLLGRLHTTSTYQFYVDYLTGLYPNLYITANKLYYKFIDPELERIILTSYGDGTGITRQEIAAITSLSDTLLLNNTSITSLDDLLYFTGITALNARFARGATNLVSVTTPLSLRTLSNPMGGDPSFFGAFRDCTSLTNVTLNEGLTTIMNRAFSNCKSLLTINIPSTVIYIGHGTSSNVNNGASAFGSCSSLTTITGGENVILLGGGTFSGCTQLLSLGDIDLSLLTFLGDDCFYNCLSLQFGSINIPCVTSIGNAGTFYKCAGLTSISLPNCTSIGDTANFRNEGNFRECTGLTSVTLSSNITKIGSYAFWHDANLATISGNISPTEIGQSAFAGCTSLPSTSIDLSNATSIAQNAFYGCTSLTSVDLSSLTTAGGSDNNGIFQNCTGLTTVTNLNACGHSMFRGCSQLSNVSLTSNCTTINLNAFRECTSLTSIDLSNVTNCGSLAFNVSGITKLVFPKLIEIESDGFSYASNYLYLEFGEDLTLIRHSAFWGSTNLTTLVFRSTTVPTYTDPYNRNFLYNMGNLTIYVPDASLNDYKTTGLWANMADHIKGISELPAS